jgi:hypothetical protein
MEGEDRWGGLGVRITKERKCILSEEARIKNYKSCKNITTETKLSVYITL